MSCSRYGTEVALRRRVTPMNVSFRGADHGIRPLVEARVKEMSAITGIPYRFVAPSGQLRSGDQVFHIRGLKEVRALARQRFDWSKDCHRRYYLGGNSAENRIVSSEIWISRQMTDIWPNCVAEQLGRVLGVSGNGLVGLPSAFGSGYYSQIGLNDFDRAALWLAYHPDLQSGMTWAEAEPIVRRIVNETWG